MNSNTKRTIKEQQAEENTDQAAEPKAPAYLEGTPVISAEEQKNKLIDRDEMDSKEEDEIVMGTEADVSPEELALLDDALRFGATDDDEGLRKSALDNTDNDGEPLNEASFGEDVSGSDLDIPGSELDDDTEMIGEEDEENNAYSLGDEGDNDND